MRNIKNNFISTTQMLSEMVQPISHTLIKNKNSFLSNNKIEHIGITGASGFLGLHLLDHLTKNKQVKSISCFIRSKEMFNHRKNQFQLNFSEEKLKFYFDINKENTTELSQLIHCAAEVDNIKSLNLLWKNNIEYTDYIYNNANCPITYISTLSIFASSNIYGDHNPLSNPPSQSHQIYGGYAQSKWLGEFLGKDLKDFKIARLGLLTPNTKNPTISHNEFFTKFIHLQKIFPYYPTHFENSFVDITPVNLAVEQIIQFISSDEKIIHIANCKPTSNSTFIQHFNLFPMDNHAWKLAINKFSKIDYTLLFFAYHKSLAIKNYMKHFNIDLFQTTGHNWNGSIQTPDLIKYLAEIYEKV